MSKLEDLQPYTAVRGILPDSLVTVVNVQWFGSHALELTYKDPGGRVANTLLYRDDEPRLEVVEQGRPWSGQDPSPRPRRSGPPLPRVGIHRQRERNAGPLTPSGETG